MPKPPAAQLRGLLQRHTGIEALNLRGARLDTWRDSEYASGLSALHALTRCSPLIFVQCCTGATLLTCGLHRLKKMSFEQLRLPARKLDSLLQAVPHLQTLTITSCQLAPQSTVRCSSERAAVHTV